MEYSLYCDESCYLPKDKIDCMVLGCCWAPKTMIPVINDNIKNIKSIHNIKRDGELKWTKISAKNLDVYESLINFFFDNDSLHFRAILIPDKSILHHQIFNQTHDDWYYKMMYQLTMPLMEEHGEYWIFLDKKDTNSGIRTLELKKILGKKNMGGWNPNIAQIQCLPSNENQMIQLADVMAGAIAYNARKLSSNTGKLQLIDLIKKRAYCSLERSTPLGAKKFNLFVWQGRDIR